jgi:hypothetical protein
VAIIEDFNRGSNDSASSSELSSGTLQRPWSSSSEKHTSISPPTSVLGTSSVNRSPHHRSQRWKPASNKTSARPRCQEKKYMPWNCQGLEPMTCLMVTMYGHWTKSSTTSARTTRRCATPSVTAGTSRTQSATVDCSNHYRCLHCKGTKPLPSNNLSSRETEAEPSLASIGRSLSSLGATTLRKTRGSKS